MKKILDSTSGNPLVDALIIIAAVAAVGLFFYAIPKIIKSLKR